MEVFCYLCGCARKGYPLTVQPCRGEPKVTEAARKGATKVLGCCLGNYFQGVFVGLYSKWVTHSRYRAER